MFAPQQRQQQNTLYVVGHGDSGQFEECRRIVDILHHFGDVAADTAGRRITNGVRNDSSYMKRLSNQPCSPM